jgi:hypothetical protein
MTPADFAALGKETVSRARDVASAAGGFLGIGKVSEAETRALQAVEEAFGS